MDNAQNRRADDKRAPGKLQWGESGEAAAPVRKFKLAFHAATNSGEGYDDSIAAGLRAAAASAPAKLTEEDITVIWQTMPGGPAGWLKSFAFLQFARAVEEQVLENNVSPATPASADNPSTAGADLSKAACRVHEAAYNFNASKFVLGSAEHQAAAHEYQAAQDALIRLAIAAPVEQSTAGAAQQPPAVAESVELMGVREEIADGSGFWRECSGCYDTEDGHPTQNYVYSKVFGCSLGNGCSECGGIGAVWDNTDYEAMARDWDKDDSAAPALNPSEVPAWQPIETAPKGGRDLILLLTPSRFPQVAYSNTWWTSGFSVENKPTHWMPLPAAPAASKEGDQAATDAELRAAAVKPPLFDKDPTNVQF